MYAAAAISAFTAASQSVPTMRSRDAPSSDCPVPGFPIAITGPSWVNARTTTSSKSSRRAGMSRSKLVARRRGRLGTLSPSSTKERSRSTSGTLALARPLAARRVAGRAQRDGPTIGTATEPGQGERLARELGGELEIAVAPQEERAPCQDDAEPGAAR